MSDLNNNNKEVDLSLFFSKINTSFKNSILLVFNFIYFLKKKAITLLSILVIGLAIGYVLDKKSSSYESEIFIKTNFNNVDYLYTKIDLLNSKLIQNDLSFLKKNNLQLDHVFTIKIEPVIDPYAFTGNNEKNFDLLKLFSDEGDINKVIKDDNFVKHYPDHIIKISSSEKIDYEHVYKSVINFLNQSEYYEGLKKIEKQNSEDKVLENAIVISQIDTVIKKMGGESSHIDNTVFMLGQEGQAAELLKLKNTLLQENKEIKIKLYNSSSIFKITANEIENIKISTRMFTYMLPLILFFAFFSFFFLRYVKSRIDK